MVFSSENTEENIISTRWFIFYSRHFLTRHKNSIAPSEYQWYILFSTSFVIQFARICDFSATVLASVCISNENDRCLYDLVNFNFSCHFNKNVHFNIYCSKSLPTKCIQNVAEWIQFESMISINCIRNNNWSFGAVFLEYFDLSVKCIFSLYFVRLFDLQKNHILILVKKLQTFQSSTY